MKVKCIISAPLPVRDMAKIQALAQTAGGMKEPYFRKAA